MTRVGRWAPPPSTTELARLGYDAHTRGRFHPPNSAVESNPRTCGDQNFAVWAYYRPCKGVKTPLHGV